LYKYSQKAAAVLPDETIPLERYIGRRNRLLAGILITQTRMQEGECMKDDGLLNAWNPKKFFDSDFLKRYLPGSGGASIKYANLYESCTLANENLQAFGVDPGG
jgi:hypothetical protein